MGSNPCREIDPAFELTISRPLSAEDVIIADVINEADAMINLQVIFSGDERRVVVRIGLFPHWPTRICLPVKVAEGGRLFLRRTPGCFKSVVEGANLAAEDIRRITLSAAPETAQYLHIKDARISDSISADSQPEYTYPDEPQVDELHQWRARDWPGKTQSLDELAESLKSELTDVAPEFGSEHSQYGGWRATRLDATGWFRTHYDGERWWLVDPDGCAFWSNGVDCIRPDGGVNVSGIENMFTGEMPSIAQAPHLWTQREEGRIFHSQTYNLERALGSDWFEKWCELTRRRIIRYGFNTIANWSDEDFTQRAELPHVFTMKNFPKTEKCIFRDFPDIYSDEYTQRCEVFARQLGKIANDRRVIGYFMTNEPQWAFLTDFNLGLQLLRDECASHTRAAFIAFIKARYSSVSELNAVWGTQLKAFDDLHKKQVIKGAGHTRDTMEFTCQAIERFVRIAAEACRAVDPNHLNLGLRWAWIHSDYQLSGSQHVDVFSINFYDLRPDAEHIARLAAKTGKPLMIGEFHIGALDRGLPSGGIRNVKTMRESAEAYRYYVEHAAAIPALIGAHYFMWNDQHVMGRFDGENMQIGLHDICYRPYPEMVASCQAVNAAIPALHTGQRQPFEHKPTVVIEGSLIG